MTSAPLEATLPTAWYRDEAVFKLEKERIFWREWVAVCRDEELPNPGDHRVVDVLGQSVILVRKSDGALRAFYNVCRHRGARLCKPQAALPDPWRVELAGGVVSGRMIVCPYHQWSYDLNGALIAAPHLGGAVAFNKRDFDLYPVGVAQWAGFVFLHLCPADAEALPPRLAPVAERIKRYPLAELRIGATLRYAVAANWKIICENYNECYHCGGVHPELCAIVPSFRHKGGADLDWNRGVPHRAGAYTFTKTGTTERRPFPALDADERVRHKGELVYPNLFVSLACDHAAIFMLRPVGVTRTEITCHFLFEPHELARPAFDPSDAVEFWDLVNRQDWSICEAVQEGLTARVHTRGFYAPMEDFNLDIRRYVTERIGGFLGA
jgi:Rieske 2Fe-2S family protein